MEIAEGRFSYVIRLHLYSSAQKSELGIVRSTRLNRTRRVKRLHLIGWLLAGVLALQNAGAGLAAAAGNPLEARLLQHSGGALYLYHAGVKYLVDRADVSDAVIDAIPTATAEQWDTLFTTGHGDVPDSPPQHGTAGKWYPSSSDQPELFPG